MYGGGCAGFALERRATAGPAGRLARADAGNRHLAGASPATWDRRSFRIRRDCRDHVHGSERRAALLHQRRSVSGIGCQGGADGGFSRSVYRLDVVSATNHCDQYPHGSKIHRRISGGATGRQRSVSDFARSDRAGGVRSNHARCFDYRKCGVGSDLASRAGATANDCCDGDIDHRGDRAVASGCDVTAHAIVHAAADMDGCPLCRRVRRSLRGVRSSDATDIDRRFVGAGYDVD